MDSHCGTTLHHCSALTSDLKVVGQESSGREHSDWDSESPRWSSSTLVLLGTPGVGKFSLNMMVMVMQWSVVGEKWVGAGEYVLRWGL